MPTATARPAQALHSDQSAPPAPPPDAALAQLIFGKCVAMAISVAAKLRIADKLAAGPKSAADLATRDGHPRPRAVPGTPRPGRRSGCSPRTPTAGSG